MKSSEISVSTIKPKKSVKIGTPVPISSISVVNSIKRKKRTPEQKERRMNKIKAKAEQEEQVAMAIIDKMKEKTKGRIKTNEEDHLKVYLDMYRQLRRIIKKTERGCLKSKTGQGAYQLATLYTQLRETISDIRALQDLSDHAETLIEKVMQPLFTTLTQNLSNSMYQIKLKTKDKLNEKRVRRAFEDIDEITIEGAKLMQDCYNKTCQDIRTILIGEA